MSGNFFLTREESHQSGRELPVLLLELAVAFVSKHRYAFEGLVCDHECIT